MAGISNESRPRGSRAFTLIELMIVVAIIATLIAILLPSLARAREQAKSVKCLSNLNAIFKGMFYYTMDPNDGNGYLPQLGRNITIGYWAHQISPYVKIKRSRVGTRTGLLVCPADPELRYRWISGRGGVPGDPATEADKIRADTVGHFTPRRRGQPDTPSTTPGPLIEPVSYTGSCDTLKYQFNPGVPGHHGFVPSKWTEVKSPHCYLLLTEGLGPCIRWQHVVAEAAFDPSFRRHYGKASTLSNGSNFLFGDGHAQWHSARFVAQDLICCANFGVPIRTDAPIPSRFDGPGGLKDTILLQRDLCGASSGRSRRSRNQE